jgi:hypothetical protein
MAYDAARQRVVLFGGFDDEGMLDDTWEWNGTSWSENSSGSAPEGRFLHAMAYDAARNRVVMFGGFNGQVYVGDTWVYDGNQWSQRNPASAPPDLCGHWMAYDAARGKVVLFGGVSPEPPNQRNQTWAWDGNTWTLLAPPDSPPARCCMAMAYDSARQRTVMFGGNDGAVVVGGTWEWNGTTWLQPAVAFSPSARQATGMAYHAGQGKMVLFGGHSPQGRLGDTWLYEPELTQTIWSPIVVRSR